MQLHFELDVISALIINKSMLRFFGKNKETSK